MLTVEEIRGVQDDEQERVTFISGMWPLLSSSQQLGSFRKAPPLQGHCVAGLVLQGHSSLSSHSECLGVPLTDSLELPSFFFEPGLCWKLCSAPSVPTSSSVPGRACREVASATRLTGVRRFLLLHLGLTHHLVTQASAAAPPTRRGCCVQRSHCPLSSH